MPHKKNQTNKLSLLFICPKIELEIIWGARTYPTHLLGDFEFKTAESDI